MRPSGKPERQTSPNALKQEILTEVWLLWLQRFVWHNTSECSAIFCNIIFLFFTTCCQVKMKFKMLDLELTLDFHVHKHTRHETQKGFLVGIVACLFICLGGTPEPRVIRNSSTVDDSKAKAGWHAMTPDVPWQWAKVPQGQFQESTPNWNAKNTTPVHLVCFPFSCEPRCPVNLEEETKKKTTAFGGKVEFMLCGAAQRNTWIFVQCYSLSRWVCLWLTWTSFVASSASTLRLQTKWYKMV